MRPAKHEPPNEPSACDGSKPPSAILFFCPLSAVHRPLAFPNYFWGWAVSNRRQAWMWNTLSLMVREIHILKVEIDGEDGLIVTFSDGTIGGYVVEELLGLRPIREAVEETVPAD